MNFRALGIIILSLFAAGLVLRPIESPAWQVLKEKEPALDLASLEGAVGQGITVGLLGGFRALVANFMWLQTNVIWIEDDLPATQTMINLVTTVDPRPTYFWLNGARMMGYDMPVWRVREHGHGSYDAVPQSVVERIDREQGEIAIRYLNRGRNFHPNNARFLIEMANLYQRKVRDMETAAEHYRMASELPDAPAYAPRIYAELLRRLGRQQEAYEWLVNLYPTLDPEGWTDRSDLVLDRIRELEDELNIPHPERFQPERPASRL